MYLKDQVLDLYIGNTSCNGNEESLVLICDMTGSCFEFLLLCECALQNIVVKRTIL